MKKQKTIIVLILMGGICLGVFATISFNATWIAKAQSTSNFKFPQSYKSDTSYKSDNILRKINHAFRNAVKAVKPAVVRIEVEARVKYNDKGLPGRGNKDTPLPFFFFRQPNRQGEEREIPIRGAGSGVIISSDGYVVTNNHVIESTKEKGSITVVLDDQREFDAKIVGTDPLTDIAVLKLDVGNLPIAELGDSKELLEGDIVLAVGNPFRLQSTVTAGIVSARGRNINIIGDSYGVEYFIQTDAAINSGNSGGALIDVDGKVVGINTAIATNTGTYAGYGFAVPINLVKNVVEALIKDGEVIRGYMGVSIRTLDATTAKALELEEIRGVLVDNVLKNSGAEKSGVKAGDVILEIDGNKISKANELQVIVSQKKPGQKVKIKIHRAGKVRYFDVALQRREKSKEEKLKVSRLDKNEDGRSYKDKRLGLDVADMTGEEKKKQDVRSGVKVLSVTPFSVAQRRGIQRGDIIEEVGRVPVKNVDEFIAMVGKKKEGDAVLLRIKRNGSSSFVALEIPFL